MTTAREVESAVARVLRRRRRRRLLFGAAAIAALVLAALLVRCGGGFGFGGGHGLGRGDGHGTGSGTGRGPASAPPTPARCHLRLDARGPSIDGRAVTVPEAVAACRGGADVIVTGDARQGAWDELAAALRAAGVATAVRGVDPPPGIDAGP